MFCMGISIREVIPSQILSLKYNICTCPSCDGETSCRRAKYARSICMLECANIMVNSHRIYNDNQPSFSAKQAASICSLEIVDVTGKGL